MGYKIAGLSQLTLDGFKQGLFDLDAAHRRELAEVEKRQDQIDTLQEELESHATRAAELQAQATETATLLADRFRQAERYTLTLEPDGGEDDQTPYWELYDWYEEETLETYGTEPEQAAGAVAALSRRKATRLTDIHKLETVEYWINVSPG